MLLLLYRKSLKDRAFAILRNNRSFAVTHGIALVVVSDYQSEACGSVMPSAFLFFMVKSALLCRSGRLLAKNRLVLVMIPRDMVGITDLC